MLLSTSFYYYWSSQSFLRDDWLLHFFDCAFYRWQFDGYDGGKEVRADFRQFFFFQFLLFLFQSFLLFWLGTSDHINSVIFLWIPRSQYIFFGKAHQINAVLAFLEGVKESCIEKVALAYHYYILWAFLQIMRSNER